jgi:hypothetical protein
VTATGTFTTSRRCHLRQHKLTEFSQHRVLESTVFQVTNQDFGSYVFRFGRDYMTKFGIDFCFRDRCIRWVWAYLQKNTRRWQNSCPGIFRFRLCSAALSFPVPKCDLAGFGSKSSRVRFTPDRSIMTLVVIDLSGK